MAATRTDPVLQWGTIASEAQRATGVPAAVILGLIDVESAGVEGRTSSAGAGGLTQFMPGTAKGYGVDVRPGHARSQIMGAARYLVDLGYHKDPQRALAAYNGGPGNPQYGYAAQVLQHAKKYGHVTTTTATANAAGTNQPAADTSSSDGGGEWGGGILSPLLSQLGKALVYIALIGAGAVLVGIGTHRAVSRQEA